MEKESYPPPFFSNPPVLSYGIYCSEKQHQRLCPYRNTPDHDDWTYRTNEQASFTIRVIRGNVALKNIPLTYEIGHEKCRPYRPERAGWKKVF